MVGVYRRILEADIKSQGQNWVEILGLNRSGVAEMERVKSNISRQ